VKILQHRTDDDPATLDRFFREARAAATVRHPNVVRAHDVDQAEGKYHYIVMDYVDGVNLHELVSRIGPLPVDQATHYIAEAGAGLQHIYECGLIHRDIKPSNLLLDRQGMVRILDLGLARFIDDDRDNLTQQYGNHSVMGTADYLAPEQALQAKTIDIRSDIYSPGLTFYFLLTGRAPYEGLTVAQKLLHHQFQEPPVPANVPEDLWAVIGVMIAKNPDDRFGTPDDLLEALAPWTALPLPPPEPAWFAGVPSASPPSTNLRGQLIPATRQSRASFSSQLTVPTAPAPSPRTPRWPIVLAVILTMAATVGVMQLLR
jgi:serine/threonine protein kinase